MVKDIFFLRCAAVRALKTFAQTAISLVTVGQAFNEVNWLNILSVSGVAAVLSILTSLAGLPEAKCEVTEDFREDDDRDGA